MTRVGNEVRLIVNADDFGMSRGITDGTILAHRYGFVTSTSLLVNMPAAEYAVRRARVFPNLAIGVHLNICQGHSILPARDVTALVDANGSFHSPRKMARRLWATGSAAGQIEAEFRAQIRWLKDRGIAPSHADSHHHMHLYPMAAKAFSLALEAEGIRCMRACPCAVCPKSGTLGGPHEGNVLRRVLVQAYRQALQRTIFRRFDSPGSRISFHSKDRKDTSSLRDRWKLALENLPPGTFELSCHPGLFECGFSETDAIRTQREQEMIWLTDVELREVIERRGIRLINYRELRRTASLQSQNAEAAA